MKSKTFNTKHGLFILNGCKLTLANTNKFITIEDPESLNEERLENIYKVVWDKTVEKDTVDELGKIAHGLKAILPQSF